MKHKFTYILLFGLMLLGLSFNTQPSQIKDQIKLLTLETEFTAGEQIELRFRSESIISPNLYISNSYGSTLLLPKSENNLLIYYIPETISAKSGIVNWKLINEDQNLSSSFYIKPKSSVNTIESYLGPPSIQAGETDFSMIVGIPTDELDNPAQDSTLVTIKTQFLASEIDSEINTNHLIAYKYIYSPKQTGRILISSVSLGTASKEFDINVLASVPTNFSISEHRNHNYADGNQIVILSTSRILDDYENVIEDGTFVEFYITTKKGGILKTSGTSINGIATAKIIHPDHAEEWNVKAFIHGMAESDEITCSFEQLFDEFEVTFSEDKRTVTVGPLKSFMQQLIPDGFNVSLSVYRDQYLIQTINKQTASR